MRGVILGLCLLQFQLWAIAGIGAVAGGGKRLLPCDQRVIQQDQPGIERAQGDIAAGHRPGDAETRGVTGVLRCLQSRAGRFGCVAQTAKQIGFIRQGQIRLSRRLGHWLARDLGDRA